MKAFIIILTFWLFTVSTTQGQNKKIFLTDKSIVKDSSGMVYPYAVWNKLIQTGNYSIKPVSIKDPNDEFILYELTEKDKEEMINRTPKPRESGFFVTGDSFGKFKTTDINRNKLNLQEMKGKIVVFNFWFILGGSERAIDSVRSLSSLRFDDSESPISVSALQRV